MDKNLRRKQLILVAGVLVVLLAGCIVLDSVLPSYHIAIKVIKKASVYSLVAVSMNLLNGFTGLFSLGQAGFMLIGAYAYSIFTIPAAQHDAVYQYFDGGALKFSLPEVFAGFLGDTVGSVIGMLAALLVGGIGVMNIMLVSVTERTREIGLKIAIGAQQKRILWQFLTEAAVLTSLGGGLGVGCGVGLAYMLSRIMGTPMAISGSACLIAVVFSMVIGIVFGLAPAMKASKLNPIDALRYQ